jgi:hypothetical protein
MVPKVFKPYLWSYDVDCLSLQQDKHLIIQNILNLGSTPAVKELFTLYSLNEIKESFQLLQASSFNKKSFNFWKTIL